jgi:hypothetical protein
VGGVPSKWPWQRPGLEVQWWIYLSQTLYLQIHVRFFSKEYVLTAQVLFLCRSFGGICVVDWWASQLTFLAFLVLNCSYMDRSIKTFKGISCSIGFGWLLTCVACYKTPQTCAYQSFGWVCKTSLLGLT